MRALIKRGASMQNFFFILSWVGILGLVSGHIAISAGYLKKHGSLISCGGAVICAVAAYGLGHMAIFALNVIWAIISFRGSQVAEADKTSGLKNKIFVMSCFLCALSWVHGAVAVTWVAGGIYVLSWFLFSTGHVDRLSYLFGCFLVSLYFVPALYLTGAYAFALNDAFGGAVSLLGVLKAMQTFKPNLNSRQNPDVVHEHDLARPAVPIRAAP